MPLSGRQCETRLPRSPSSFPSHLLTAPAFNMVSMERTPSPQPASAIAETAHSTPSQPPPTLHVPSPAPIAPQTTRAQKRKLDTEDGSTCKRLQTEPPPGSPPGSPPAVSPELLTTKPRTLGDNRNHDSRTEGVSRDHDLPTAETIPDHETDTPYHETEDLRLSKPRQPPTAHLSEANLEQLEHEIIALEEMDNIVTPSDRGRKRASSRQTSNSDLASTHSKGPTPSPTFYRYNILDQANVYILPEPPPQTLQAQLDIVFKRKVLEERRREISDIAKEKSRKFCLLLRGAHREDDLVELVHETLFDMHKDETLTHPRKAGKGLANLLI